MHGQIDATFKVQLIGVVSYGIFTLITCFVLWFVIKTVIGIRAGKEDEEYGLDMSELGAVSFQILQRNNQLPIKKGSKS